MKNESFSRPLNLAESAAVHYDEFFGPMFFEPYAIEITNRIDAAGLSCVLELAAGTGRVTRHLRRKLKDSTRLIASDISKSMLQEAQRKLGELNIEWQYIDAQHIGLPSNTVDLVVCCFGYMFVEDKPAAMAEASRVLKPGGSLLFSTWSSLEENGASYTSVQVAADYLGAPVPASALTATSMHDEAALKTLMDNAGFTSMQSEKVNLFSETASAQEAAAGFVKGSPLYKDLAQRMPQRMEEIQSTLETALAEKFGAAPMRAPISAIITQGWK